MFAAVGSGAECNYWPGYTSSDRGDGIGDIHLPFRAAPTRTAAR